MARVRLSVGRKMFQVRWLAALTCTLKSLIRSYLDFFAVEVIKHATRQGIRTPSAKILAPAHRPDTLCVGVPTALCTRGNFGPSTTEAGSVPIEAGRPRRHE